MKRYKRGSVSMSKKELIAEHKRLVHTLRHPTKEKLRTEARKQAKELREYRK